MEKVRVLLVDDEPSFTRMLKLNLEKRGFTVMVENNGAYAYTVAQDFMPDFIWKSRRRKVRKFVVRFPRYCLANTMGGKNFSR